MNIEEEFKEALSNVLKDIEENPLDWNYIGEIKNSMITEMLINSNNGLALAYMEITIDDSTIGTACLSGNTIIDIKVSTQFVKGAIALHTLSKGDIELKYSPTWTISPKIPIPQNFNS